MKIHVMLVDFSEFKTLTEIFEKFGARKISEIKQNCEK